MFCFFRRDLEMPNLPFPYDFERAVDDWVFMCFFVGNDFLPHLPSLEIREGAIDRLVRLYKDAVYKTGGFLTKSGIVNPNRVQIIMQELGKSEDAIFKKRRQDDIRFRQRMKRQKLESDSGPKWLPRGQFAPMALGGKNHVEAATNVRADAYNMRREGMGFDNQNAAKSLKAMLKSGQDLGSSPTASGSHGGGGGGGGGDDRRGTKRRSEGQDDDDEPPDEVKLYEDGFKDRYYESKFGVLPSESKFRHVVAYEYTIGLCWVLRYYYQVSSGRDHKDQGMMERDGKREENRD